MKRYFVSQYTDGPATRWNVVDRRSQEWVIRFADKEDAEDHAAALEAANHVPTAEEQIERRVDFLLRELDELCAMATHSETVDLVKNQEIAIGQVRTRAELILSFLKARQPSKLRVVSNG